MPIDGRHVPPERALLPGRSSKPCTHKQDARDAVKWLTVIAEIFVRVKISYSSVCQLSYARNFRTATVVSDTLVYVYGFRMLLNFVLPVKSTKYKILIIEKLNGFKAKKKKKKKKKEPKKVTSKKCTNERETKVHKKKSMQHHTLREREREGGRERDRQSKNKDIVHQKE